MYHKHKIIELHPKLVFRYGMVWLPPKNLVGIFGIMILAGTWIVTKKILCPQSTFVGISKKLLFFKKHSFRFVRGVLSL